MNKKKIAVLTTCRADFGIMKALIDLLQNQEQISCDLLVTGTHLSKRWGYTVKEIEDAGTAISYEIPIIDDQAECNDISRNMARALTSFSDLFKKEKYNILVVLGDRYETLAVCIAAVNNCIPIAHLHGGEITMGALDDCYRHAITKMSFLHFTSTKEYQQRVIQMGEAPDRVFHVGALGVENIKKISLLTRKELQDSLQFDLEHDYAVVTFHPVTLERKDALFQVDQLIQVLKEVDDLRYIITYANSDEGGQEINNFLHKELDREERFLLAESLGMKRYLSAVKYSKMVIGNSSSGIIEVPSFHVPTIDIGNRQEGRIRAESVISCKPVKEEIRGAIMRAYNWGKDSLQKIENPYEGKDTAARIADILVSYAQGNIDLQKKFFDLEKDAI